MLAERVLQVPAQCAAILAMLMLRGWSAMSPEGFGAGAAEVGSPFVPSRTCPVTKNVVK